MYQFSWTFLTVMFNISIMNIMVGYDKSNILILERNEAPNADVSENAEETSAPECPKSPKSPIVKTILVKSLDCNYVEGCSLDH